MLEQYFIKPQTLDRVRSSWLSKEIEKYVTWLEKCGYSPKCFRHRVPLVCQFGEFTWKRGARRVSELPAMVKSFERQRVRHHRSKSRVLEGQTYRRDISKPIEQMLEVVLGSTDESHNIRPFVRWAPEYFSYLEKERGLRIATIDAYSYYLSSFEKHLIKKK